MKENVLLWSYPRPGSFADLTGENSTAIGFFHAGGSISVIMTVAPAGLVKVPLYLVALWTSHHR